MLKRIVWLAVTAVILMTISAPVAAGPNGLPFKMTTEEWRVSEFPVACPTDAPEDVFLCLFFVGEGEGNATHLGNVQLERSHTVLVSPIGVQVTDGHWSAAAANGDQLQGSYSGTLIGSPVSQIDATFTITGGTGRFQDAEGAGTNSGFFDTDSGEGEVLSQGSIRYGGQAG